jgi:hypothetical protein
MAYTYDPSQNIQQGFQQAASGVGNIFTQIIAQQQRDYSLAENALNNVEALKKNIGIWGTKEITDGANNLLGQVSSAINKNGKLDYSKLGQVRQEISNLADLKTGYDVFGKQFDRLVQVGAANKENLTSFESFYKNLVGLAADKKLIANPNDLATAMNNVLEDHINTSKMGITAIKNNLSVNPITGMYVDPKTKMEVKYNANVFDGVTVGADGRLVKPTDPVYYQALAAKIKASDPAAFDAQRRKLSKIGQSDIPDADIVKSWFDSMPAGEIKPVSMKNEREIQSENIQVKTGELKLKNLPTEIALENQGRRANILQSQAATRNSNATADLTQSKIDALKVQDTAKDLASSGIVKDANGNITINYGKNVLINSAQVYNPKTKLLEDKPFVVVNRKILKDGSQQLIGFVPPANMSKLEALQASVEPKDLITTPLTKTNYTNLNSVYISKPFNKELARRNSIAENLASENALATKQPTPPKPSPTPKPAPAAATTLSISLMTRKYGEEMVNGRKLKDLSKDEQIKWGKSNIPGAANANFVN